MTSPSDAQRIKELVDELGYYQQMFSTMYMCLQRTAFVGNTEERRQADAAETLKELDRISDEHHRAQPIRDQGSAYFRELRR